MKVTQLVLPGRPVARLYLITGLDCGLDCWTGLMDWITGLTFDLYQIRRVDWLHVCISIVALYPGS